VVGSGFAAIGEIADALRESGDAQIIAPGWEARAALPFVNR
jgi:hypothetical protein